MEEILTNYGILTSISWNTNEWKDDPTAEDLAASKYNFVKENAVMHEGLNFGNEIYPIEENGYYVGYTPMFITPPSIENSKNVQIVFFVSSDYKNSNRKSIVGLYGYPEFGETYHKSQILAKYNGYNYGNIKAKPDDIIFFQNPVIINNESVKEYNLLPEDKMISQQGFNYLNSENVHNIVKIALSLNKTNIKLKAFVEKFPLKIEIDKEIIITREFFNSIKNSDPHSVLGILELEERMKNKSPEVKERISKYIERGRISSKVKKLTDYKCLICEAKALKQYSFVKSNGIRYIETHHVIPVSSKEKGTLSISNLITVCANHHRQLHYGNSKVLNDKFGKFKFEIDDEIIEIKKVTIVNNCYE